MIHNKFKMRASSFCVADIVLNVFVYRTVSKVCLTSFFLKGLNEGNAGVALHLFTFFVLNLSLLYLQSAYKWTYVFFSFVFVWLNYIYQYAVN